MYPWERRLAAALGLVLLLIVASLVILRPFGRHTAGITNASTLVFLGQSKPAAPPLGSGARGWPGSGDFMEAQAISSDQIAHRLTETHATTGGDVEVSLAWNTTTDLDLSIKDAGGEVISAEHRQSQSGGTQDVDANPTLLRPAGDELYRQGKVPGAENVVPLPDFLVDMDDQFGLGGAKPAIPVFDSSGQHAPSRFTRHPVEHIFFSRAPHGIYTVYVRCFSWRESNRDPLPFTVEIRFHGQVSYAKTGTAGPANYCANGIGPTEVCQFVVP